MSDTLAQLSNTIDGRKGADPSSSYVAKLFAKAPDAILKKVAEEAGEFIMACKDADAGQGPEALVAGQVYEVGKGLKLLTPLQG